MKWKEIRNEGYTRKQIISTLIYERLRNLKWLLMGVIYIIYNFKHTHIWHKDCRCFICKKRIFDIKKEK